jgi:hypothetical protein
MGLRVCFDGVLCFKVRVGVGVFFDGVLCFKVGVRTGVRVGVFLDGDSSSAPSKTLSEDISYSYI